MQLGKTHPVKTMKKLGKGNNCQERLSRAEDIQITNKTLTKRISVINVKYLRRHEKQDVLITKI